MCITINACCLLLQAAPAIHSAPAAADDEEEEAPVLGAGAKLLRVTSTAPLVSGRGLVTPGDTLCGQWRWQGMSVASCLQWLALQ